MKKTTLIIFGLLTTTGLLAQTKPNKNIPAVVQNAFTKQYPTVKSVKWDKEETDFEASFDLNGLDNSALFDAKGNLLETETEIKELPKEILAYIKAKYPNQKITESAKITNAKGQVSYEAEIKGKDLIFDSKGAFLKEIKK
ncbi:PepSY-like domain-containing protein [Pedobacter cryophilus]|uniref:Putative beta-lactamase-inhibitor-like PepSY-like domain-containing protein n=1 Tax=Pedobacter cryophilus TaxID=2571271 RepID=A0A4V5NX33_9SPHI|nr:PepSY-like domain-containing protein [Pedobacter cryophilus]TKB97587.1 hypothetical protein FA046_09455 [Pedobacter cryophilus]